MDLNTKYDIGQQVWINTNHKSEPEVCACCGSKKSHFVKKQTKCAVREFSYGACGIVYGLSYYDEDGEDIFYRLMEEQVFFSEEEAIEKLVKGMKDEDKR